MEIFWDFGWNVLEEFFERNFLGGFFRRNFLGGFFGEDFFGRNSLFTLLKSAKIFVKISSQAKEGRKKNFNPRSAIANSL